LGKYTPRKIFLQKFLLRPDEQVTRFGVGVILWRISTDKNIINDPPNKL